MGWLPFWRGHFPLDGQSDRIGSEEQRVGSVLAALAPLAFRFQRVYANEHKLAAPLEPLNHCCHSLSHSNQSNVLVFWEFSSPAAPAKSQENGQFFLYQCKQKSRMRSFCPSAFLAGNPYDSGVACCFISYCFVLFPEILRLKLKLPDVPIYMFIVGVASVAWLRYSDYAASVCQRQLTFIARLLTLSSYFDSPPTSFLWALDILWSTLKEKGNYCPGDSFLSQHFHRFPQSNF